MWLAIGEGGARMVFGTATDLAAPRPCAVPWGRDVGAAMLGGGLLALLLTLPKALAVWSTGIFLNPDDAMRAVELRDFMAGQGWYDLVPHRLSPDHPFTMHWSRLVDTPLALIEAGFGLVLPPAPAELAMRLLVPCLLFLAALRLITMLARNLIGPRGMLPAALLFAGSAESVANFIPGHIHHHAAQATLLIGATALLIRALSGGRAGASAAGAGALAALSLGIGLQNLPFVLGFAAIAGSAWVLRGQAFAAGLSGFGAGLGCGGVLVFLADVPPEAYGSGACDAFSTAHLLAATAGGAIFLVLASFGSPLRGPRARGAAAALGATLLVALLAATYPVCLHDPMAGVDPLLRDRWLSEVGEALPLARLIAADWTSGLPLALALLVGVLATVAALLSASPAKRAVWAALMALALIGVLGTIYQVRVAASALALLVPGVAAGAIRAYDALARRPGRPALLGALLVALSGNDAAWGSALGPFAGLRVGAAPPSSHRATTAPAPPADSLACFAPALYAGLARLPPGLVLSTIDPGSAILAATPHSVLAAPYHRNTFGNRVSLLAFEAGAAEAEELARAARATYLVLCRASNEAAEAARHNPQGLAALLLDGRPPGWLEPLGAPGDPLLVFRVRP